ncbi:complement component 7b [Ictalurus punctatus]|uniref:Complement component C7 n=1 Tax=Ictalurus punctatus TaxID=7998 RepID=A0A2D0T0R4_ICTPU|nr:complement component 7b [Ictalurus punctatus]
MKKPLRTVTSSCLFILLTSLSHVRCQQPVNCIWGTYGSWSECDGCTKTQVRTRSIQVFPQFGGSVCTGEAVQRQACVPTKSCPLDEGCGDRFRCSSGQCISSTLVCNGDNDCQEDSLDEQRCAQSSTIVCNLHKTPPNSDLTGKGFDVLTGKLKAGVINTLSFGGQCRKVFSGDHRDFYRLPQSILRYSFQVAVDNDFSEEFYNSSWSYIDHVEQRYKIKGGHDHKTFHNELKRDKAYQLLIIKNEVEVAQFQNNIPEYLPLSEEFWRALSALPNTYDPAAYRSILQLYGTHYMAEGSLGGEYQLLLEFDSQFMSEMSQTDIDFHKCVTRVKRRLFRKKRTTKCEKLVQSIRNYNEQRSQTLPVKTNIIGGHGAYVAGLGLLDLENPEQNHDKYAKWAGSVKDFPQVIKQKLRPIYELVKEGSCAQLKKLHLKRALEAYLEEQSPCHCRPCQNNGKPVLSDGVCTCVCKPDTSGASCQNGHVLGEQPGVVHGGWNCWSPWGTCSQGQKSRTRTCNNPAPKNGGKHCVGPSIEHKACEDPDLGHLRFIEPHCFDPSLTPVKSCKVPPPLQNGFVLSPKDVYAVGSKIEYTCIEGYYHVGDPVAECTKSLNWRRGQMECKRTSCDAPPLLNPVIASPSRQTYSIGETVSLSCPFGMQFEGQQEIICRASLSWFPIPNNFKCKPVVQLESTINCKPWEKPGQAQCVCKMPYECGSSLQVCASVRPGLVNRMGVCHLGALQCLGQTFSLLQDTTCNWPETKFTSCQDCKPWEECTGLQCNCKDPEDCPEEPAHLCVSVENGGHESITECEAGAWRCSGKDVRVINIGKCPK